MYIHYVWMDFKNESNSNPVIPELYQERIALCKRVNSDCEIKIWNGPMCRDLIDQLYPQFRAMYDGLPEPIMRCDAIRYFILHHFGGFYLDIDRICIKPLSKLLLEGSNPLCDVLLGAKSDSIIFGTFLGNDFMWSKPGADFMKWCMEGIKVSTNPSRHQRVLETAGPLYIKRRFESYKGPSVINILYDEVNVCDQCGCSNNFDKVYTVPDQSTSDWHQGDWDESVIRFVVCNRVHLMYVALIVVLVVWLYCRQKKKRGTK